MENDFKVNDIDATDKEKLISRLIDELPVLRTKLGLSQEELGNLVGISRQTYSSIETGRRKMSWSMYLSLIFIFDYDEQTHTIIHSAGLFLDRIFKNGHLPNNTHEISSFMSMKNDDIKNYLDERAIHAIETVIMMEYARCNNMSGEAVIKAFDGKQMTNVTDKDKQGYIIVRFNGVEDSEEVLDIFNVLSVADYIASCRCFTYRDKNYRLVFLNEKLDYEETLIVLSHEEGHI